MELLNRWVRVKVASFFSQFMDGFQLESNEENLKGLKNYTDDVLSKRYINYRVENTL
ncbi:hypothetical protein [Legionella sainthelensi]|uniref:hypothetical protein n=1 Tax=Legionella sainthelensi TaxID=28087 RepID=UPI00135B211B|nr:hypothetical protein [Legionella sainthelensi]